MRTITIPTTTTTTTTSELLTTPTRRRNIIARRRRILRRTTRTDARRRRRDDDYDPDDDDDDDDDATTTLTMVKVRPGQGKDAPTFPEMCEYLVGSGRCEGISPKEFKTRYYDGGETTTKKKKVTCVDVRQPLEFSEWRVPPFESCPYQIPSKNAFRRMSGYALSIKGGLKERDEAFVEKCAEMTGKDVDSTVVVCDLKGGSIRNAQSSETSNRGVIDRSDSFAVRACYELVQAGFADVKFVEGGFPGLIDDAGLPYESEKYMDLLRGQSDSNRKLLMYAKLLPDPTILPGIAIQGGVFLILGLAFYNVGGIGDFLAENVPAACSFLPIQSCS